jgi:hypothetical protein
LLLIFRCFILALALLPAVAFGAEGDWRVTKATQQVNFTLDKQSWNAVQTGDVIPNNAWISTGPKGRAQLTRGVESIVFQPNTLAGVFTSGTFERKTEVVQRAGVLDLEIEKRDRPHTTVQTPFLAAVVKGTKFRVSVTKTKAAVSVNRGLVQVTSFATGQRSNVAAGQSASVDSVKGMTVAGLTSSPAIAAVEPSMARVAAVGTTTLSGQTTTGAASGSASAASSSPASSAGANTGTGGGSGASAGSSGDGSGRGASDRANGPGKSDQSDDPSKPGKPDRPDKPGRPDDPGKPGKPDDPGKPGKPDDPGKPGKPDDPGKPGKPDDPGKPGKPDDPGKPGKPDDPGKPGKPDDPGKPGKPDDPGKPGKPDDPGKPGKPDDPGKPGKPDDPGKPGKPDDVGKPGKSDSPVKSGKANNTNNGGPSRQHGKLGKDSSR